MISFWAALRFRRAVITCIGKEKAMKRYDVALALGSSAWVLPLIATREPAAVRYDEGRDYMKWF